MDPNPPTSDLERLFVTASSPNVADDACRPDSIPGYQLLRSLDRGGQGVVYEALQESTNRKVAIKVVRDDRLVSESAAKYFEREIRLASQLHHPNIVTVFDSGKTPEGRRFLVMDYVRGQSLRDFVVERKLNVRKILELFSTVCHAVAHAHEKGVIHRDLKPSNILVDAEGHARLLDFGLAKSLSSPDETLITVTGGAPVGTYQYMSPEQTRGTGGEIDARTDVYSLGVILYELLTGQCPFPSVAQVGLPEAIRLINESPPTPPSQAWKAKNPGSAKPRLGEADVCPVDRDLDTIVLKSLAKERNRRYRNAGELGRDLNRYIGGEPIEARRDSPLYPLRLRTRRWIQRNNLVALIAACLASGLLVDTLGGLVMETWTGIEEAFLRRADTLLSASQLSVGLDKTRLIALTDSTDVESLARESNAADVSAAQPVSLRRLHGRLMERLAAGRPRCVVWDITFPGDTPYDDDFVRGVRALNETGIDVAVTTAVWWLEGVPPLSSKIAGSVSWGSAAAGLAENLPWNVHLVAQRGSAAPRPSLALAAFVLSQYPRHGFDLTVDAPGNAMEVRYWPPDSQILAAKTRLPVVDRIRLTALQKLEDPFDPELAKLGLRRGDLLGLLMLYIPPDDKLLAATIPYETAFRASEEDLREKIQGKVVVLGDLRTQSTDRFRHPDGRTLSGADAHLSGIEALQRRATVWMPRQRDGRLAILFIAGCGGMMAVLFARRTIRRYALYAGLSVLCVGISAFACWRFAILLNPLLAVLALVIAGEWCAAVRRLALTRNS